METSLTQTFNETAAAAYKAFPKQLKKLVVLLTPTSDTPVYVSPEVADQLTKSTAEIKGAVESWARYLKSRGAAGVASKFASLGGTPVNLIALDTVNTIGIFNEKFTKDMILLFALDHEIGHHILKNGYLGVSPQMAESAASAYATLRHIQRFGKNTDHIGEEGERTAYNVVLRADTDHYTTDAVQRAFEIADERDITNLSLKETAELADKIAVECRIDSATLDKIRTAYNPAYEACKTQIGSGFDVSRKLYSEDKEAYALFCKETLAVMKQYRNDADIFKVGKQFLSYPPVRKFMTEAAKTDPSWQEALNFIDNPKAETKAKAPKKPASMAFCYA